MFLIAATSRLLDAGPSPTRFGLVLDQITKRGGSRVGYLPLVRAVTMTGKEPPMFDLTDQQHAAIAESGAEPIVAVDPRTRERYVLVRAEVYERIKGLLANDQDWSRLTYPAAMATFREGWDDPRMDVYDELDPRKQP
jgi:hypothetical protein